LILTTDKIIIIVIIITIIRSENEQLLTKLWRNINGSGTRDLSQTASNKHRHFFLYNARLRIVAKLLPAENFKETKPAIFYYFHQRIAKEVISEQENACRRVT
jgi:hypothetical protein